MRRLLAAFLAVGAAVMLAPAAGGAERVTVERDTQLRAEPRTDAPGTGLARQGTVGEVLGKSGAWLNVRTPEAAGWLFSFNVRFQAEPAAAEPRAGGTSSALGRLFGPRRSVQVTSTIGIRGLEEEDLKQARFDAEQLRQLDQFAVTKEAAEKRARAAGLAPVRLEYLGAKQEEEGSR